MLKNNWNGEKRTSKSLSFSFMFKLSGNQLHCATFFNSGVISLISCTLSALVFNAYKIMLQLIQQPIGSAPVTQLSMWSFILEKAKGIALFILVSSLGLNDLFSIAEDITSAWQKFTKLVAWHKDLSFVEREFIACFLHSCLLRGFEKLNCRHLFDFSVLLLA